MGWQTSEALWERKLQHWKRKGVLTKQQVKDVIFVCHQQGFWDALGMATRLKYRNLRVAGHTSVVGRNPKRPYFSKKESPNA